MVCLPLFISLLASSQSSRRAAINKFKKPKDLGREKMYDGWEQEVLESKQ